MARHFRDEQAPAPQPRRRYPQQDAAAGQAYGAEQAYGAQQGYAQRQAYGQAPYQTAPYGGGASAPTRRRRRRRRLWPVILLIAVVVVAGVGVNLFLNPPFFKVSVNGAEQSVSAGMTVQGCIDEGLAAPSAGNLMAVDGSVAQEGGGSAFTATVNGEPAEGSTVLKSGDQVQIDDGADVEEDYTETTEAVAHGTSGTDYSTLSSYYNGSIHVMSAGEDGEKTIKTGNVSGKTAETVTKEPVDAGYSSYTVNTNGEKVIALTFDDGPWPTTTSEILDILKENGAHATFFQIGNQVANMADVEKRIVEEGNQVGTHTWDHASGSGQGVNLTYMTADEQREEITKGFDAIESVLGTSVTHIMRAPGGNYYGSLVDNLSDLVTAEIGWDLDTEDWSRPGASAIEQVILSVEPGQVILMHDGGGDRSQTVEALRTALPQLIAQGYKCVTIDELMSYAK